MRTTFRQLTIWLWLGGPVLGALACGEEDNTSPITGPDMAAAAAGTSRIAFLVYNARGDRYDIYNIVPDGSGLRQLTSNWSYDDHLNWAPGGASAKIAAVAGGDIYAINANGSGGTNLTNTPNARESYPVWSPDGSKIVYTRDSEVYVMNSNGSGQTNLTRSTAGDGEPGWSPDGRKIVFVSGQFGIGQPGVANVHVINADGSGKRKLTNTTSSESAPAWSPDGRQIAFVRGHNEIYVMNSDGSRQINVTNHPAADGMPFWSPNSAKIAFNTARKGNSEVYVMGRYGGSKTNLTQTSTAHEVPRGWSPGGARILYESGPTIWVMNADGSNKKQVTSGRAPAWSR